MVKFEKHSGIYTLSTKQYLPLTIAEAWDFFSTPENLAKITPDYMGFNITSKSGGKMHAGQIITYKIGLLPEVKSSWVTEITHVKDKKYFVDEQRFGPYAMWHHEHFFEEQAGGVNMYDKVSFKLPFGVLGQLVYPLIKRQLNKIFTYRYRTLEQLFPTQ